VSNHRDAQSLFEKVHAQHPNVVVIGRSLGTGVAVRLASEQPVSRLVLITPYDSFGGNRSGSNSVLSDQLAAV
jgi:pimeloyl-ACP methyl ester carboxylesterase